MTNRHCASPVPSGNTATLTNCESVPTWNVAFCTVYVGDCPRPTELVPSLTNATVVGDSAAGTCQAGVAEVGVSFVEQALASSATVTIPAKTSRMVVTSEGMLRGRGKRRVPDI